MSEGCAPSVAIDFGTARVKVAYYDEITGSPQLAPIGRNDVRQTIPSLFHVGENEIVVGDDAADRAEQDPKGLVTGLKREIHLGGKKRLPGKRLECSRVEIASHMFIYIRSRLEKEIFHKPVDRCVLTVPVCFEEGKREMIRSAAERGGFRHVILVDEPVAAGRAWLRSAAHHVAAESAIILDIGGGTSDFALLKRDGKYFAPDPLVPPSGHLWGGDDLDETITEAYQQASDDRCPKPYLVLQLRRIRERLSDYKGSITFKLPDERKAEIDRQLITDQTSDFLDTLIGHIKKYVDRCDESGVSSGTPLVLIGGASRIEGLEARIREATSREVYRWIDSDYAVVLGAVEVPEIKAVPMPAKSEKDIAYETYKAKVEAYWDDGEISGGECNALMALRERLSLSQAEAEEVELLVCGDPVRQLFSSESKASLRSEAEKLEVNDSLARAHYEEAANALQCGDVDTTIQKLSLCLMLSPSLSEARELLVEAFAANSDLQSAIISAKAWADASPDNPRAWAVLGRVAFEVGDFSTSAMVLGRNLTALDSEGLLRLAASLFRQGKAAEASCVLEKIRPAETDPIVRTIKPFLLAWFKRGSDYNETDLRNYTEALVASRRLTSEQSPQLHSMLSWFGISFPNFNFASQNEILCALITLNQNNLREAVDAFVMLCGDEVNYNVVWLSSDPDSLGSILVGALCTRGHISMGVSLIKEMCKRIQDFDIRLIQNEPEVQRRANNPLISPFFEPALSVTENHGIIFNDVTATNVSVYSVTNVTVTVQVIRQGGKSDAPFTVSFAEISPHESQSKSEVFKNAGWFGGDVEKVNMTVACDQQFSWLKSSKI